MAPAALLRMKRRYQHFCPAARALETIGEKWSLLIVRDLLGGPRRFSDLRRSLAAITPKWLSARLRALESDGIVTREVAGEREVWYRLTPKGQALETVFDALLVWGMDHALGPPRGGEAIHPGRAMDAIVRYLGHRRPRGTRRTTWVFRFGGDRLVQAARWLERVCEPALAGLYGYPGRRGPRARLASGRSPRRPSEADRKVGRDGGVGQ